MPFSALACLSFAISRLPLDRPTAPARHGIQLVVRLGGLTLPVQIAVKIGVTIFTLGADLAAHRGVVPHGVLAGFALRRVTAAGHLSRRRIAGAGEVCCVCRRFSCCGLCCFRGPPPRQRRRLDRLQRTLAPHGLPLSSHCRWRSTQPGLAIPEFRFDVFAFADKGLRARMERLKATNFSPCWLPVRPGSNGQREESGAAASPHSPGPCRS